MSLKFPKLKTTNCIVAFLSSALQAFGIYNIHALSGVTEGGVLGATLLFDHWFGLSPAVSSFVLNIACYVLGWRTLGKSFIAYSAIAACGYSASYAICELFPPLWPGIASLPLLASVVGALFIGVGAGLCVDHNGGGEHLLEIADAAHVLALLGLGGLILKIFTQIAERAGDLHILEDLRHEHFLALAELLAHFLHINGSQFVMHGVYLAFFPLKHRRMLSFVGKRNGVVSL